MCPYQLDYTGVEFVDYTVELTWNVNDIVLSHVYLHRSRWQVRCFPSCTDRNQWTVWNTANSSSNWYANATGVRSRKPLLRVYYTAPQSWDGSICHYDNMCPVTVYSDTAEWWSVGISLCTMPIWGPNHEASAEMVLHVKIWANVIWAAEITCPGISEKIYSDRPPLAWWAQRQSPASSKEWRSSTHGTDCSSLAWNKSSTGWDARAPSLCA